MATIQTSSPATNSFCKFNESLLMSFCNLKDGERQKCGFYKKGRQGHCMWLRRTYDNACDSLAAQLNMAGQETQA